MATEKRDLVVVITHGLDHESSSTGWIIALGGTTAGIRLSIFLVSSGVGMASHRAPDLTHAKPREPMAALLGDYLARGGTLWARPVWVNNRADGMADPIDGVLISGASVAHDLINGGAATLNS